MRTRNFITTVSAVLFCLALLDGFSYCQQSVAAGQYVVNTRYTQLVFQTREDVREFDSEIDFSAPNDSRGIFSSSSDKEVEYGLIAKTDALFAKVQRILDMRKRMKKVRVNIYTNEDELHRAFYQIYKRKCTVRGWYMYSRNTVYLNVNDVHEGMLAHELAHAIIDHYLSVKPPRATAEILARYADEHLFDQVKTY